MLLNFKKKRAKLQAYTWFGLPLVVIGGWFYPKLGFFLLACMIGAVGIAFYKGRAWCDWMCPRGSFYDLFLQKISRNKGIPAFFRKRGVRIFMLSMLLSVLGIQVYFAWGNIDGIGMAMVKLLTITTAIGIILGIVYQHRIWCHICPMGTISNWMSEGKHPLNISEMCVDCKVCSKVCPMQLKPYQYKEQGVMGDNDCVKCSTCTVACPKKALNFEKEIKKAA
ncbi:MAG: 4Fe-4S binding protein [Thermodesulfovibrionales bacterium]|nr:4Fe-4S binding protein [Thermodesulfovibrionales bacterium]